MATGDSPTDSFDFLQRPDSITTSVLLRGIVEICEDLSHLQSLMGKKTWNNRLFLDLSHKLNTQTS